MSLYSKILGHESIILQLKNIIRNNMVGHSYIFSGEDGSGKRLLAEAFSEALLCENNGEEGCDECHSCKTVLSGNNPDVKWITHEKPSSIGVDDIREQLIADIRIKPYSGRYKIYILDEAEKLTEAAQNALLKTIEEPPSYGIIIFLTNNQSAFLPTITSRCCEFSLKPIREGRIAEYLISNFKISDYEAKICAAFCQGRLGKAINLMTSEDYATVKDEMLRMVKNIYNEDIADLIDSAKRVAGYKIGINDFIDLCEMWYRDVLLFKVTKDPNGLAFQGEINYITKQASKSSYEGIETIINACEKAKIRLKANVNFETTMELLFLTVKEN